MDVEPPDEGEATEMELLFDENSVSARLRKALEPMFSKVSVIPSPPDGGKGGSDADARWIAEAEKNGADLVVVAKLLHSKEITSDGRDWLGAPGVSLFVEDRIHHVRARLELEFYDLSIAADSERGLDATSLVEAVTVDVVEVSSDLLDRTDSSLMSLVSVLSIGLVDVTSEKASVVSAR